MSAIDSGFDFRPMPPIKSARAAGRLTAWRKTCNHLTTGYSRVRVNRESRLPQDYGVVAARSGQAEMAK